MQAIRNPILRGFHPDPSVCRVGDDYYLACSSFEYFPGLPIFHSRDLAHWRPLGAALNRPAQNPLNRCGASRGQFAPTIRHHAGTFYLVGTNVGQGGNFLVTARHPAGPWSDPVRIDDAWFDPSLFFDDDGKVYYTRRGGESLIVQAEIDVLSGRLLTPLREIAGGFVSPDCEGPHVYRRGAWYYLLLAEGGSRSGHMVTIGRARSPWGPFAAAPHNPILSNRHLTNNPVRAVGHGDLFDASDGTWWLAFLGTRHEDYETFGLLGRESHLAPVTWNAEGWPVVNGGKPADAAPVPLPWTVETVESRAETWNFADHPNALADPGWLHLRATAGVSQTTGSPLQLTATEATLADEGAPAFLGRRVPEWHVTFSARLASLADGEGGVAFFLDHRHHFTVALVGPPTARRFVVGLRVGDAFATLAGGAIGPETVDFALRLDGTRVTATIGEISRGVRNLGSWDIRYLAPEVAGAWTGLVAVVFAQSGARLAVHRFSLTTGGP